MLRSICHRARSDLSRVQVRPVCHAPDLTLLPVQEKDFPSPCLLPPGPLTSCPTSSLAALEPCPQPASHVPGSFHLRTLFFLLLLLEKLSLSSHRLTAPPHPSPPHVFPTSALSSFRSQFRHHLLTQALPGHLAREPAKSLSNPYPFIFFRILLSS